MSAIYLIDGKPHRQCDCDESSETCKVGRKRQLMTCGFNRCMVPAPEPDGRCQSCDARVSAIVGECHRTGCPHWEEVNICTFEGCGLPALDQPKSAGRSVCWKHDPGR